MKMKIINQITIIKAAYILLLAVVILVSLEDASTGFMDGWQGVTNEKSNNNLNYIFIFKNLLIYIYVHHINLFLDNQSHKSFTLNLR